MIPTIRPPQSVLALVFLATLAACAPTDRPPATGAAAQVTRLDQPPPPGGDADSCWALHVRPAVIETETSQVLIQPEQRHPDGSIARPAAYRTETRQQIVRERAETRFETPCAGVMTDEFVASVQRALKARGLYHGPVNGLMDARTRAAGRRYQAPQGLDTGILSLAAAQRLGLVADKTSPSGT